MFFCDICYIYPFIRHKGRQYKLVKKRQTATDDKQLYVHNKVVSTNISDKPSHINAANSSKLIINSISNNTT